MKLSRQAQEEVHGDRGAVAVAEVGGGVVQGEVASEGQGAKPAREEVAFGAGQQGSYSRAEVALLTRACGVVEVDEDVPVDDLGPTVEAPPRGQRPGDFKQGPPLVVIGAAVPAHRNCPRPGGLRGWIRRGVFEGCRDASHVARLEGFGVDHVSR